MENLTSCYFIAPKTNIFFQYIPLVSFEHFPNRSASLLMKMRRKTTNIVLVSVNFLCVDTSNTLVCTWTYFKNDSKKRTKWNKTSIFNRWTQVWILFVFNSEKVFVLHIRCDCEFFIFLGMKNETSDCEIDCKKKQLVSPKISNEEFPGKISRDLQFLNDQELLKMFPEYILEIYLWAVLGSRLSFPNRIFPKYNRDFLFLCLSEWYSEACIHLFIKGCYTLAWRMSAMAFWLPVL